MSSGFKRKPRVVPPVANAAKEGFQTFKHEFLLNANMVDISGHFVGQETRVVPGEDLLKQKAVLLRKGFQVGKPEGRTKRGKL